MANDQQGIKDGVRMMTCLQVSIDFNKEEIWSDMICEQ